MNERLLDILECPFCGGALALRPTPHPDVRAGEIVNGILACQCCAYPVVDGIPFLRTGNEAAAAMRLLGAGQPSDALLVLLGLTEPARAARFTLLLQDERRMTFRGALEVLSRDAEGVYLLYRFSDPTFLCTEAVLAGVVEADDGNPPARVLDVCGGAGHLARRMHEVAPGAELVVADIVFWKLWLAKRFVAPRCEPVCCDAASPLPFAREAFSLSYCSDAFHYVWPRRLLAGEMMRATDPRGALVLAHLHNALCENPSAGMPLTPAGYRRLLAGRSPRLLKQSTVFEAVVSRLPVDLADACPDSALTDEPALMLIAGGTSRVTNPPRPATPEQRRRSGTRLGVNPLYAPLDGSRAFELRFPSAFYAEEFAECRRYLPDRFTLPENGSAAAETGEAVAELIARRALLELPDRYL